MHDQRQVNGKTTTTLSKEIEELHKEGNEHIGQVFYKYKAISKSSLHFLNKPKDSLIADRQVMRVYRCKKAEKTKTFRLDRKPALEKVNTITPPLSKAVTPDAQKPSAIKKLDLMALDPSLSSHEVERIKIVRQLAESKKLRQRQVKTERQMLGEERAEFFEQQVSAATSEMLGQTQPQLNYEVEPLMIFLGQNFSVKSRSNSVLRREPPQ